MAAASAEDTFSPRDCITLASSSLSMLPLPSSSKERKVRLNSSSSFRVKVRMSSVDTGYEAEAMGDAAA